MKQILLILAAIDAIVDAVPRGAVKPEHEDAIHYLRAVVGAVAEARRREVGAGPPVETDFRGGGGE